MKKVKVLFPLIFLLALLGVLWQLAATENQSVKTPNGTAPEQSTLPSRTEEQGSVTVEVTPSNVNSGSQQWQFKLTFSTHSVELSDDLTQSVALIDDKGTVYKPLLWEGSPPGGHHRQGVLGFSPIRPFPKSIELRMMNVGGVATRSFKWDL